MDMPHLAKPGLAAPGPAGRGPAAGSRAGGDRGEGGGGGDGTAERPSQYVLRIDPRGPSFDDDRATARDAAPAGPDDRPAAARSDRADRPRIILVGKTSLANHLVAHLDMDHHIGTGFIRAVLQSQSDAASEPALFRRTYQSERPIDNLRAQSVRLLPAVRACIDRATSEGTSLVLEGTHLLPDLYHGVRDEGLAFIVLRPPAVAEHRARLTGHRHTRRPIDATDVRHVREIGDFYASEALRYGVPTICYGQNFDEIVEVVTRDHHAASGDTATGAAPR
jgi:hypothetical protein